MCGEAKANPKFQPKCRDSGSWQNNPRFEHLQIRLVVGNRHHNGIANPKPAAFGWRHFRFRRTPEYVATAPKLKQKTDGRVATRITLRMQVNLRPGAR
jgi:hypothetical protein